MYPIAANLALIDGAAIATYLEMLFGYHDWEPGQHVALRGVGEKGTAKEGSPSEQQFIDPLTADLAGWARHHAERWGQHHFGSFIVPAVLRSARAREEDVALFTAVHVDIDSGDTDLKLEHLERCIGPATMVVASGGITETGQRKMHVYWRLMEATDAISQVVQVRSILATKAGGDYGTASRAPQIIRIPGTVHAKGGRAAAVTIERFEPRHEYDIDDMAERAAEMPVLEGLDPQAASNVIRLPTRDEHGRMDFSGGSRRSVSEIMVTDSPEGGGPDGNRWTDFNSTAGNNIRSVRMGLYSIEEAKRDTYGWMQRRMLPPWPDKRFEQEWHNLLQVEIGRRGPLPQEAPARVQRPSLAGGEGIVQWAAHRWSLGPREERQFLVQGLVMAEERHLFAAAGGVGKTFTMLDLAMRVAAHSAETPQWWLGQPLLAPAEGKTAVLLTAEDSQREIQIRMWDIDPSGELRRQAGDRLIVVPLPSAGGAFPLVELDARKNPTTSRRWSETLQALRDLKAAGHDIGLVVIDTLNATLHGDENAAQVISEYFREAGAVCSEIGAALFMTHHLRKPGQEPIRTMDDLGAAIRGSGALIANVRVTLGAFSAPDYGRRLRAMGVPVEKDVLFRFGVAKRNNPELMTGMKTLLRTPCGLLEDVTHRDVVENRQDKESLAWLVLVVRLAAEAGHPYVRSAHAGNGPWTRKYELPDCLRVYGKSEMNRLIAAALEQKLLVQAVLPGSGKQHNFLDVPEGKIARGEPLAVQSGRWAHPDWSDYGFDHDSGTVGITGGW